MRVSLRQAASFDSSRRRDLARAVIELAIARARLGREDVRRLISTLDQRPPPPLTPADASLVERIAFIIPRVARWLPFRADCLVQALAAQRWLENHSIITRLTLGARKNNRGELDAHAWLEAGNRVVTGGDVTVYSAFRAPNP